MTSWMSYWPSMKWSSSDMYASSQSPLITYMHSTTQWVHPCLPMFESAGWHWHGIILHRAWMERLCSYRLLSFIGVIRFILPRLLFIIMEGGPASALRVGWCRHGFLNGSTHLLMTLTKQGGSNRVICMHKLHGRGGHNSICMVHVTNILRSYQQQFKNMKINS